GELLVVIRIVLIDAPLSDVTVHVVEAPGIGLFLTDLVIAAIAIGQDRIIDEPGVVLQLFRIVAEAVGGLGAGAAGVFPFGLGGQAIKAAGLFAEPLGVLPRGKLGHDDRR